MKKAISLLLVIALTAAIAISGTLAYLTDRENETNVFTMGDVAIDLDNQFAQGIELTPGIVVDNTITITNTGANDAWVWYTVEFDECNDEVIEVNGIGSEWTQQGTAQLLNAYLPAGDSVTVDMQIALDPAVDIAPDGKLYKVVGGNVTDLGWNISAGNPVAYINAYAIQTDKFATVEAAYAGYIAQWGGLNGEKAAPATVAQVSNADELVAAFAGTADVVVLTTDVTLKDEPITISGNKTLNLNGKTLEGYSTSTTSSNLLKVNMGATLTLANGTVSFEAGNPDTDWGVNNPSRPFPGYANNTLSVSGTLIIDGATIENKTAKGGASYAIDCYAGANLIINDGVVKGYDKIAIRMFNGSASPAINVTVNGGEISGYRAFWIQSAGSDAAVAPDSNLTINGGVLKSTDAEYNQAIYSYSYGNKLSNIDVALNGGTIYGDVAFGGGSKNGMEKVTVSDKCTIYGSVFSYDTNFTTNVTTNNAYIPAAETKADVQNAVKAAVADGKTNIVVDAGGEAIGDLNYGVSKDMVPAGTTLTIQNAVVSGSSYGNQVDGTVVFENCTFENENGAYSIHFDAGSGNVVFNNCTLSGWCSFGTAIKSVKMNNCTVKGNGIYALVRFYQPVTMNNCIIDCSNAPANDSWADGISVVEACSVEMKNCTVVYADYECAENGKIVADGTVVAQSTDGAYILIENENR